MAKAYIQNELRQRGKASVLLFLKAEHQTAEHIQRLHKCFRPSDLHRELKRGRAVGSTFALRAAPTPAPAMLYFENLGVAYGQVDEEGWDRLQSEKGALDEVDGAPPLQPITGTGSNADVAAAPELSWGVAKTGAPALWKQGLTGKGVLIGHLDTGIDATHPALQNTVEAFQEIDLVGQPVPGAEIHDSSDHGTHTAGTIAGRTAGGRTVGMAPGCKLVSAIVIENGDPAPRLLAGVNWALGFPIKVLNMSLGFPGYYPQYAPLLRTVRAKGVLPVFAAGNLGPGTSYSPANYNEAMAVGAIDESGSMDPDSSSERLKRRQDPQVPDLVLPGVDVISANAGGGFRADSGTSMAAPHASGLAALLWEAFPHATVDQMERAIYASCARSEELPVDRAGRGFPDAVKALAALHAGMKKTARSAARG